MKVHMLPVLLWASYQHFELQLPQEILGFEFKSPDLIKEEFHFYNDILVKSTETVFFLIYRIIN